MSFILDALKKSETDRQRQNGPALFEVRAAPPRDKLPLWAVGLGVLLAVNLVIVAWVLLHRPASPEAGAQPAATSPALAMQASQGPYGGATGPMDGRQGQQGWQGGGPGMQQGHGFQAPGTPGGQQGSGMQQGYAPSQTTGAYGAAPANGAPAGYGAPSNGGQGSYGASGNGGPAGYGAPANGAPPSGPMAQTAGMTAGQQPGMPQQQPPANGQSYGGSQPQQPDGMNTAPVAANQSSPGDAGGEKLNPDDYAPATDPAPQPFGNHVTRGTLSGVPLYSDVAATNHLPTLRLDLHVYAAKPQERFVMINMHKLHEGDLMSSEGVRVETITPYGAVLSHDGTKFLLPRD